MTTVQPTSGRNLVRVFCSYSHEDEKLRKHLETHLAAMRRGGLIKSWSDREIVPGTNWEAEINTELEEADIVLMLVSPAFIASEFCYSVELQRALERFKNGEAMVIPVALRPCDWDGTPLAGLQALPTGAKPVTEWSNRDKALLDVTKGIRRAIEYLDEFRAKTASVRTTAMAATHKSEPPPVPVEGDADVREVLIKVFGRERYVTAAWMLRGLERAKAVARIERLDGKGYGTGVLVSPEDFPLGPADQPLLLTLDYVVSRDDQNLFAIRPEDAVAFFELLGVRRRLGDVLWSSSYRELNATLVTLTEPVDATPCRVAADESFERGEDSNIFLIGHPLGGRLSFSLWNSWLDDNERFLHYRAATEPGSGGSPVFDEDWKMLALHHKRSSTMTRLDGSGTYEACEGVSIRAIRQEAGL
jgi:hypothetical protein